jgi:hypothetical protein
MPILDPVSPFLALIDRLISLVQERKTRRRDYFEKIIDPLYSQFTPLGEDYLALFRAAKESINGPKRGRKARVAEIATKREGFVAARMKLRALLERCETKSNKQRDEELVAFLQAMLSFFRPMVSTAPGSLGRELVDVFVLWSHGTRKAIEVSRSGRKAVDDLLRSSPSETAPVLTSTEDLTRYIGEATARLEEAWYEIAGRYMELKLKYVAS